MAVGFRSPFFIWVGGLNSPSGVTPPSNLCTCPDYRHDPTTGCTFKLDGTLSNAFKLDGSLTNAFKLDGSLSSTFKNDQTLTNQWGRRNCNG
jgi:hypothetical protein